MRDARAKAELDTVRSGILRQGDGQAKRVADARLVAHQGTNHPGIEIGLQLQGLLAGDHAHAADAIGPGATLQLADGVHLRVVKGDNHRAVVLVAETYLGRQARHHPRTRHVVARLERAGNRIVPAMHDAAVGARRAAGDVVAGLEHEHVEVVARQLARHGATGDTRPDHDNVAHASSPRMNAPPVGATQTNIPMSTSTAHMRPANGKTGTLRRAHTV